MNKLIFTLLIIIKISSIGTNHIKIDCNLTNNNDVKDSVICNANAKRASHKFRYKFIANVSNNILPFEIDSKTSDLVWLNKYQQQALRWSELCPSNYLVSTYQQTANICHNPNCDSTGYCVIKYEQVNEMTNKSNLIQFNLNDNINYDLNENMPMFPIDLKFINITFDLEYLDESSNNEIVMIESTEKIDPFRSKINRIRNEFDFVLINLEEEIKIENDNQVESSSLLYKKYCKSAISNKLNPFKIRYDIDSEKLFIKYKFDKNDFKLNQQNACFLYKLSVKRQKSSSNSISSAIVLVNLFDNRFDKPVFDFQVYNFTIDENSPLNTIIGKVSAVYLNRDDSSVKNQIKYKIVPFETNFETDQILDSEETLLNNGLQIKINPQTGLLSQKSNIDREKHLITGILDYEKSNSPIINLVSKNKQFQPNKPSAELGLIRFNIEASFESMTYGYSKVNIFIRDINDNPPIAKIKPLATYVRSNSLNNKPSLSTQSNSNEISNLYVSENTAINQILAYVGVNDPDAGENGTVKSIDLSLVNYRKASNQTSKQREHKYIQLKKFHQLIAPLNNRNEYGYERITCLLNQYAKKIKTMSFDLQQQPQIPFKLNKISEKFYTIQLSSKLDFTYYESYSIEMRIQDNGTRPQLESRTRINLNVLDQNDNYPVFLNSNNLIKIIENKYDSNAVITENGEEKSEWPIIFKAHAIDLDDDYNGLVKYSLVNNPFLIDNQSSAEEAKILLESTFNLNKDTGELKLLRSINSENLNKNQLDLIIMAIDQSDSQKLNKTMKLTINLIDVNNNHPKFDSQNYYYKFYFSESERKPDWSNFKQIASAIYLTDMDSFETNSKEYLAENLAKTSNIIKSAFLNELVTDSSISYTKPKLLFNDEICLKSFNINLINSPSSKINFDSLVFFIESDQKSMKLYSNRVTCKMSIWLDINKFKMSSFNSTNKININFDLQLDDFGLKSETSRKNEEINTKANFNIDLINIQKENNALSFTSSFNKTNDNKYLIEINEININEKEANKNIDYYVLFEFENNLKLKPELKSVYKLERYLNDSSKIDKIDFSTKLKIIKDEKNSDKSKLIFKRTDNSFNSNKILGVYLIDFYLLSDSNVKILKKIDMVIYNNFKKNQTYMNGLTILNEYNKEYDSFLMNDNQLVTKLNNENSIIDSSLIQFQNLLFGSSNTNSQDAAASFFFNKNGLLNGLFLNNRSTFIQIIIISLIISVLILATLICCIVLLIKKNCSNLKGKHKKGNKKSTSNLSNKKTINVIDDESITTGNNESKKFNEFNILNEENGGFISKIIKIDEVNDKQLLKFGIDKSKDKVNRYLDGLNGYEKQQVIIVAPEQNETSSSSSPTSSTSLVDSKKNLIIPVDLYDKKSSYKYNSNKNDKLSTTSSSCVSDEGCYGSSDFSSESNNKQQSITKNSINQKNKPILSNSNVNTNYKAQLPVAITTQSIRQQKNYCINNLSRFEKIYNHKNELDISLNNDLKTNSSTFSSSNKSSTVFSPNISLAGNQTNNIQVITSISGSYV